MMHQALLDQPTNTVPQRRGMSLVELMVTITIISSIAALVIPASQGDGLLQARAAATVLRSDIELTQVMTMTDPANPMVICFNEEGTRYWIASASNTEIPLSLNGNNETYVMTMGEGRLAAADGVTINSETLSNRHIGFDMNGAVSPPMTTPIVTLQCGEHSVQLEVSPMTGTVTEKVIVTNP